MAEKKNSPSGEFLYITILGKGLDYGHYQKESSDFYDSFTRMLLMIYIIDSDCEKNVRKKIHPYNRPRPIPTKVKYRVSGFLTRLGFVFCESGRVI